MWKQAKTIADSERLNNELHVSVLSLPGLNIWLFTSFTPFLPDVQLHPTFSEQPPTNGANRRQVKKWRGQRSAAYLLLWVKSALTRPKDQTNLNSRVLDQFAVGRHQSKRYILAVKAEGAFLFECILVKEAYNCYSVKEKHIKSWWSRELCHYLNIYWIHEAEDIFLYVSILPESVSPLCFASPAASAPSPLVPSSAGTPIHPLSNAGKKKTRLWFAHSIVK